MDSKTFEMVRELSDKDFRTGFLFAQGLCTVQILQAPAAGFSPDYIKGMKAYQEILYKNILFCLDVKQGKIDNSMPDMNIPEAPKLEMPTGEDSFYDNSEPDDSDPSLPF